jgi:hypothetical protein
MSNRSPKTCCLWIMGWISFLSLWGLFTLAFLAFNDSQFMDKVRFWPFLAWLVIYPIYIYVNYQSPERRSLKHQANPEKINEYIEKFFYNSPQIRMEVQCYHMEDDGEDSRREVTTSSEDQIFEYLSWRDISGRFRLDSEWAIFRCWKYYVLLELNFEISFADGKTLSDYENKKQILIRRNMDRDKEYRFREDRSMIGGSGNFTNFNLIKISDKKPLLKCLFNNCNFIIFCCLLPFSEIYKFLLNLYFIRQCYDIKKVISTTLDLNSEEFRTKLEKFNPCVIIGEKEYQYSGGPKPVVSGLEFTTYKDNKKSNELYIANDIHLNEKLINNNL